MEGQYFSITKRTAGGVDWFVLVACCGSTLRPRALANPQCGFRGPVSVVAELPGIPRKPTSSWVNAAEGGEALD